MYLSSRPIPWHRHFGLRAGSQVMNLLIIVDSGSESSPE